MALPLFSDNMLHHERILPPPGMTWIATARPASRLLPVLLLGMTGAGTEALAQDVVAAPASTVPASPSLFAPPVPPVVQTGPLTFAPLVRQVGPAVVNIAVSQAQDSHQAAARQPLPPSVKGTPFEHKFRERMRAHGEEMLGAGSGFLIDPGGVIVTNAHVVGGADQITVSLSDGTEFPARLVGSDDLTDIAVIQIHAPHPMPFVPWGDSRLVNIGDWIMAAGNPFGLGSSVTAGIVSARGRDIGTSPFDDFFQIDAPINPGNSGGPSFNLGGQVVAVNTAIVSPTGGSVGIGFGLPSEIVAPIVEELRQNGHIDRGWLGVTLADGAGHGGVQIVGIDRDGPAMKAHLRIGDVITAVNDEPIDTARMLIRSIAAKRPHSTVTLHIRRRHDTMSLEACVSHRPDEDLDD
ncbi:S1C family serine protease [Komagataeibacter xylinus]|uniref:PDZ domain-containing protein n=1 Tax=Komagataeibacter xylinus TaxID=28448 RepID=A0A857FPV0_KOMXY|nr:trypsin-like peptidase domain-containing protein [Komagataeibacter xylinus]QHC35529.1 PDZ domain-containing protein [Komagataeibacter xylinus]